MVVQCSLTGFHSQTTVLIIEYTMYFQLSIIRNLVSLQLCDDSRLLMCLYSFHFSFEIKKRNENKISIHFDSL